MPRIDPTILIAAGAGLCGFLVFLLVGVCVIVWFLRRGKSADGTAGAVSTGAGRPKAAKKKGGPLPAWESDSRILGIVSEGARLVGLTYTGALRDEGSKRVHQVGPGQQVTTMAEGAGVLRRHDLDAGVAWERTFPDKEDFEEGRYGRIGDTLIFPKDGGGVVGLDPHSGEERWSLSHESGLHRAPYTFTDGTVLLFFKNKMWVRIDPSTGARQEQGTISSDKEVDAMVKRGWKLTDGESTSDILIGKLKQGGVELSIWSEEINCSESTKGDIAVAKKRHDRLLFETETWPKGKVSLDGWSADDEGFRAGNQLGLLLYKPFGETAEMALGLFEPSTMERTRQIDLGTGPDRPDLEDAYTVDGHAVVVVESLPLPDDPAADNASFDTPFFRKHDAAYILDAAHQRVLARLPCKGHLGRVYQGSDVTWKGKL